MTTVLTERKSVQNPIIKYATEIGWQKISLETALSLRKGEGGVLLYDVIEQKLKELNPGVVDDNNVREILRSIENARSTIEGNREILRWLKGDKTIFVSALSRELNVRIIDFENPDRNIFQVTPEWQYTNGRFTNRADIMFLINGIPVAMVETKAAHKKNGIEEGIIQVRRYHRETPEMVTQPQIFDVPNIVDFYYGVTWNSELKDLFNWRDEERGNFEKKVKVFFDKDRFLRLIMTYILFYEKDEELKKVILRQHQTRAVEKAGSQIEQTSCS